MFVDRSWVHAQLGASIERRLMIFFGVVYFAQGAAGGLLTQPLTYYLKSTGMAADAVAAFLAVAAVPWMLKPLYGLISDFIPLYGYRRKSYLMLMACLATMGFLALTRLSSTDMMIAALFLSTLGLAAGDVMVDALMVENGQKFGLIRQFQGQQWTWLNLAAVTTALLGGWLSQTLSPASALHTAAVIMVCAPIAVIMTTIVLVDEPKVCSDRARSRRIVRDLFAAMKSRTLWIVAGFVAFWNLTPNFGTPLYYHMTDRLGFEPGFIGQLTAIGSLGAAAGAFLYRRYLAERFSMQRLIYVSITLSVTMTLTYLSLGNSRTAVLLYFAAGVVSMIPLLTLFSLAASVCPPQAAGFTFAMLMSIYSAAAQVSAMVGAHLYERVFHHEIAPLICVAAAFTLTACLWVPFLPIGSETSDEVKGQDEACAA